MDRPGRSTTWGRSSSRTWGSSPTSGTPISSGWAAGRTSSRPSASCCPTSGPAGWWCSTGMIPCWHPPGPHPGARRLLRPGGGPGVPGPPAGGGRGQPHPLPDDTPRMDRQVEIPALGEHMIYPALIAAAIGERFRAHPGPDRGGHPPLVPTRMRMNILYRGDGIVILTTPTTPTPSPCGLPSACCPTGAASGASPCWGTCSSWGPSPPPCTRGGGVPGQGPHRLPGGGGGAGGAHRPGGPGTRRAPGVPLQRQGGGQACPGPAGPAGQHHFSEGVPRDGAGGADRLPAPSPRRRSDPQGPSRGRTVWKARLREGPSQRPTQERQRTVMIDIAISGLVKEFEVEKQKNTGRAHLSGGLRRAGGTAGQERLRQDDPAAHPHRRDGLGRGGRWSWPRTSGWA